ncbi:MAG: Uma2 family endonuclease [Gemmataceae bacterium]|nr:Uma2 family endonuclease [Gemmataceae bacterium]
MSAAPKPRKLTEDEYLAIDRAAEVRSEFYDGVMSAMSGAKMPHNRAKDNLAFRLNAALVGGPCYAVTSDMRVKVRATGFIAFPDVVVVCGEAEYEGDRTDILLNPAVLVEVLSDSTAGYDRGFKRRQYKQIPGLREYVLVAQDEPAVDRYARRPDGTWVHTDFVGLDAVLEFAGVPARVRLADIYAGVTFPEDPPGRPPAAPDPA